MEDWAHKADDGKGTVETFAWQACGETPAYSPIVLDFD